MKTAPFLPFNRSFLPEPMLRKTGFIQNDDTPYERSNATKTTHHEYYKVIQESIFGPPSNKILRLDSLRKRFVVSETEKGRGNFLMFTDIKQILIDDTNPIHVTVLPIDRKLNKISFNMENPTVAKEFVQKLDTLVQAMKIADKWVTKLVNEWDFFSNFLYFYFLDSQCTFFILDRLDFYTTVVQHLEVWFN